jgi:hypothetical protein
LFSCGGRRASWLSTKRLPQRRAYAHKDSIALCGYWSGVLLAECGFWAGRYLSSLGSYGVFVESEVARLWSIY